MTISEIKNHLKNLPQIAFRLPNGTLVPRHFHVTEIGKIQKNFIDCGGTTRKEQMASLQLWEADDYDHRLHPEKLKAIIDLAEDALALEDLEIEVEYQGQTIEKFSLGFDGKEFLLLPKQTDCLAREKCSIPQEAPNSSACAPGSGCC